jgi:hypothetical protein
MGSSAAQGGLDVYLQEKADLGSSAASLLWLSGSIKV